MITRFVNRDGTSVETIAKKHRVLAGFFRYAVTRCRLKASPMPSFERKRGAASFTPYIFSEAELKRLLAAVPAASGPRSEIDADTPAHLRAAPVRRRTASWRGAPSQGLGCRPPPIAAPHSRHEVLQDAHRPHQRQTERGPEGIRRKARSRYRETPVTCCSSKRDGTPLTNSAIGAAFRRLRARLPTSRGTAGLAISLACTISGIRRPSIESPPGIASGADLNDLLPKLATYLGHKDLSGTQRYLTMTEELLAEASRRFEAFAQGGRHD